MAGSVSVPDAAVETATAEARAYCGWHVTPIVTETLVLDGSGSHFLFLPTMRVVSVESVTEDDILRDPSTYQWSVDGRLWSSVRWSGYFRAVVVELTHGHATADDFAGVITAATDRGPSAGQIRQVGQVAYQTTGDGFLDSEKRALDRYRIPQVR